MRSCLIKGRFVRASIFTISRAGHLLIKGTIVLTSMSYVTHPAREEKCLVNKEITCMNDKHFYTRLLKIICCRYVSHLSY